MNAGKLYKRGSVEIIAFLLILPLLLMPIFNSIQNFIALTRHDMLKQVTREALLIAETHGGLTQQDVNSIINYLSSKGFDASKISIDYSPAPVNYGSEVYVKITYDTTISYFTFGLGGFKKVEMPLPMSYGPIYSISKYYQRQ
ncbi:hypothetical protein [Thermoanaerobacter pentosaceus]|uniref:TadE family protein n=1 Tax=Thermoanaerobacter pentosaceus TaxID=694059 RepID=A0ABT9M2I1_9THEO|nr:hypothetical protein [Thermoanaerobacter pentosaceus]MDP9750343.1 hypothetical protein [Thermoanaerobacter pentosaceus]